MLTSFQQTRETVNTQLDVVCPASWTLAIVLSSHNPILCKCIYVLSVHMFMLYIRLYISLYVSFLCLSQSV